jgi:hypothetical protein
LLYMNHHDIAQALERYADHPVLGPASFTLTAVANAADHNSDGWAYWPKPVRAARQLIELIGSTRDYLDDRQRPDATPERLERAYRPLKAFRTRTGIQFRIYTAEDLAQALEPVPRS